MAAISFINGIRSECLPLDDRGLAYGDGLFETIAVTYSKPQLFEFHLRRLQASCAKLSISLDTTSLIKEVERLLEEIDSDGDYVLKIIITREAHGRGYAYKAPGVSQRILQLMPLTVDYTTMREQGVRIRLCDTPLSVNPMLAGMKHLCRLENVLARAEWSDESIYEGLMKDMDGFITEGVMSNLFLVKDNMLSTPHLDRCGVAGVMREYILSNLAPELLLPSTVDRIVEEQVNNADELFICNSLIGIVPVIAIASFEKVVGPITQRLQGALADRLDV